MAEKATSDRMIAEPREAGQPAVYTILEQAIARYGDRTAVWAADHALKYAELGTRVKALAKRIAASAPRNASLGILLPYGVDFVIGLLACLAARRTFVLLDVDAPELHLTRICQHAGAVAVLHDHLTKDLKQAIAPQSVGILVEDAGDSAVGHFYAETDPQPDRIAFIAYTSGSTGAPKGVCYDEATILALFDQPPGERNLQPEECLLPLLAATQGRTTVLIISALTTGAVVALVNLRRDGFGGVQRAMAAQDGIVISTSPPIFRRLVNAVTEPGAFGSVRLVVLGGDRTFASDIDVFRRRFPRHAILQPQFGSTECFSVTAFPIHIDTVVTERVQPAGRLLPGQHIALRGADGREVAEGEVGEIFVTSRTVTVGYWRDPDRTQERVTTDPFNPGLRTMRTGDLGRLRHDGVLEFHGRSDRMVKIRGHRVEPGEIEAVARSHPAVEEAAIIVRCRNDDAQLVLYFVLRSNCEAPPHFIRWLAERLPPVLRPGEVHAIDAMPMLETFKPDLAAIEALDTKRFAERALSDRPTTTEQNAQTPDLLTIVADAWKAALPDRLFDPDLSWEAQGGDSLRALELAMRLEKRLGRRVPPDCLLLETTPRDLASRLQVLPGRSTQAGVVKPQIFFLPGAAGPLMHQAEFRRAISGSWDLRIMDYPAMDIHSPRIVPLQEILDHTFSELNRLADEGPLRLVGYSIGGYLAFEIACRMQRSGREIEFLGIVDTPPPRRPAHVSESHPDMHVERVFQRLWSRTLSPKGIIVFVVRAYLAFAYRCVMSGSLSKLARFILLIGRVGYVKTQMFLWWHVTHMARRASLGCYIPGFYDGPVWLFRTPFNRLDPLPPDYGWGKYCRRLFISEISGEHENVFAPKHAPVLAAAMRDALRSAKCMA